MPRFLVIVGVLTLPFSGKTSGQEPVGMDLLEQPDQPPAEILIQVMVAERNLINGRMEIVSKAQIRLLDRETGVHSSVLVGWSQGIIPIPSKSTIHLQITPAIRSNQKMLLRAITEVVTAFAHPVPLGNGETGDGFKVQHFESTLHASNGETVVTIGMHVHEHSCPWLDELPFGGDLLRVALGTSQTELIVVLTPRIVRTRPNAGDHLP